MQIDELIQVKGCITQEKYIRGKGLEEIEHILGFHSGRLNAGMVVACLLQIPAKDQFNLLGYTQVAEHRFSTTALKGLDEDKLKEIVLQNTFRLFGINRLIKVMPNIPHQKSMSDDEQYPPGHGVPQWKLTKPISAKVVAIVLPGGRYV